MNKWKSIVIWVDGEYGKNQRRAVASALSYTNNWNLNIPVFSFNFYPSHVSFRLDTKEDIDKIKNGLTKDGYKVTIQNYNAKEKYAYVTGTSFAMIFNQMKEQSPKLSKKEFLFHAIHCMMDNLCQDYQAEVDFFDWYITQMEKTIVQKKAKEK